MTTLLWCDGTFTAPGRRSPVSEAVRHALHGTGIRFQYVDHPAAYGPASGLGDMSYEASLATGIKAVRAAANATSGPVLVGGYSAGAVVARRYLRAYRHPAVIGYASLGDPHTYRHRTAGQLRSGIAGHQLTSIPATIMWVAGDPIADLAEGSPLRSIADLTAWMSVRSTADAHRWALDVADRLGRQRAQAWWQPWRWPALADAGHAISRYLGDHHTERYVAEGVSARLASSLIATYT